MKKILVLLVLMVVNVWAVDVAKLQKAHKEALKAYSEDKGLYKSIEILNKNGVSDILGKQPKSMPKAKYIHILNDYAFFLYKAKNYEKALSFFRQVLLTDPSRTVTYLNTADNYKKMYESPKGNNSHLLNAIQYYEAYAEKIKPQKVSKEIQNFLAKYKDMKLVPLTESYIVDELSKIHDVKAGYVFKYLKEDGKQFCQNFVNNAKLQVNIEVIQPKIITNDLFDPKFVKLFPLYSEKLIISLGYRSNTPANNVDQNTGAYTGVLTNFYPKDMQELEKWRARHNLDSIRQFNIRFYDVDIDNNVSNGKGKIVFTEGSFFMGQYFVLDANLSRVVKELSAYKETNYDAPRLYLDEIIKYENKYYVLNLKYNEKLESYKVTGLRRFIKKGLSPLCKFNRKGKK